MIGASIEAFWGFKDMQTSKHGGGVLLGLEVVDDLVIKVEIEGIVVNACHI